MGQKFAVDKKDAMDDYNVTNVPCERVQLLVRLDLSLFYVFVNFGLIYMCMEYERFNGRTII